MCLTALTNTCFKNESMTVSILFVEYIISLVVVLAMYRVCNYMSLMSLVMFPEGDSQLSLCSVARKSI